jgi:hypothetical protein
MEGRMRGKLCKCRKSEREHEEKGREYCIKKEGIGRRGNRNGIGIKKKEGQIEELNTKRPTLVFLLATTKPLLSYG